MTTRTKFPKTIPGQPFLRRAKGPGSLDFVPTAVTLFSGLGSSSLALHRLGFRVIAHDFMPEAVASLNANGFDAVQGDIRDVDFTHPMYSLVRIIVGGPPCQPFSQGGRNAGEDDPRDMIPDFIRSVRDIRPETFVLENVRGLAGPRHRAYLDRRVAEFEALGYVVDWRVLNAADFGTPQDRKRLIMVGRREATAVWPGGKVNWPAKWVGKITMARALGWSAEDCVKRNALAPEPAHDARAALWPLKRPSTTVVGSFKPEVQAAPGFRAAGDGPRQNAPGSVVTTPAERLILQELPEDWKVIGSKTKVDLQIGNSVPCGFIGKVIRANITP